MRRSNPGQVSLPPSKVSSVVCIIHVALPDDRNATDYETLNSLSSATATVPSAMQKTISDSLRRLPPLIAEQQEKEKDEVLSKLKDLGNTVLGQSSSVVARSLPADLIERVGKFGFSTDNFKFTQQASGGYSMNFGQ